MQTNQEKMPEQIVTRNRLMIVEDESIVAMDLSYQLEEMGYEVCAVVDNGEDAVFAAAEKTPDLILMDIVIKGDMDGIEAGKQITHRYRTPIIFVTAYTDKSTVERAALVAPYGYISKPYQAREMRAVIEVALYKSTLERRLRESEQWFSTTLRCVGDAVIATDRDGKIKFMNPIAESCLGYKLDEVMGRDLDEVMVAEDPSGTGRLESFAHRTMRENKVVGIEFGSLLTRKDGRKIPIDDSAAPIRTDDGEVLGAIIAFRDVSARIEAEKALLSSEDRFRKAFSFAPVGMALVGMNSQFLQVNEAFCKLLQMSAEELLNTYETDVTHAEDIVRERPFIMDLLTGRQVAVQFEKRYQTNDYTYVWVLVSVSLLTQNDQPFCYLYQVHDLTERKMAEERLDYLAHHDVLTDLANRTLFMVQLETQLLTAKRNQEKLGLLFIDLDHFKQVNDSLGHAVGDDLLKFVANRLAISVRETDLVARLGGDEFVILLPKIKSAEDIATVTAKIRDNLRESVTIEGHEIRVSLSIGVSIYPDDGVDAKSLLQGADSALYQAKAEGRDNVQFYRPELTHRLNRKINLERDLRHALERHEFVLHYQPIISNRDGIAHGAEALIRWQKPERGLIEPDEFIGIAEESGLIVPIGAWVLHQACTHAKEWNDAGMPLEVSVNVSPRQFKQGDIYQTIADALMQSGLPPAMLTIEVTEQLLLNNTDHNTKTLSRLRAFGVKIAIDDFGTGYSSLSYIGLFEPDKLKIDRAFLRDVENRRKNDAIVRAIIAMAHSLDIVVVAEGVETQQLCDFLRAEGCDMEQGYHHARPDTKEQLLAWYRQR